MASLIEVDALEVLVIVDNEVDPISSYNIPGLTVSGQLADIAPRAPLQDNDRGSAKFEIRLDNVCCGAHGLSLMVTAIKGQNRHTVLFDTAPEEHIWELNAKRLRADIGSIEWVQLSHWHRDHSGGMLKAVAMINQARSSKDGVVVDLHPNRPASRGFQGPFGPVALERDPTFDEIEAAGATVVKNDLAHTILDDMFLVSGEIPRVTPYEVGFKRGMRYDEGTGTWESDELILDERFLMCNIKGKGVVVFTGCSHAGVVNVAKHALQLAGTEKLHAVIGGYHLVGPNEAWLKPTIADLKELNPDILMPGHCSGWRAKVEIENTMPGRLAPSVVGTKFSF
ncbi:beta-lactamase-like protein [Exophiala viscosa]|uniref:beta-lactamase-like protein n=1 Tax=Exophiala viscosa TaxID=2486360 RepID=UPI0021A24E19|nr:beta-lactamase-like protein [Exophiala viscosa]